MEHIAEAVVFLIVVGVVWGAIRYILQDLKKKDML